MHLKNFVGPSFAYKLRKIWKSYLKFYFLKRVYFMDAPNKKIYKKYRKKSRTTVFPNSSFPRIQTQVHTFYKFFVNHVKKDLTK